MKEANRLMAEGKSSEALEALDRLLATSPDNLVALYNRGLAHQRLERWPAAEADYRRVLAERPDDLQAVVNLTSVLRAQGKLAEAETRLRTELESNPFEPALLNSLAIILRQRQAFDEAERVARKVLMRDERNVDAHKNLAAVAQDRGQLRLAESLWRSAQQWAEAEGRTDADILVNLGLIYRLLGDPSRAASAFQAAVAMDEDHLEANFNLGSLALAHRDYDRAAGAYARLARRFPESAEMAAYLGFSYQGQRRLPDAVKALERARALYQKTPSGDDDQVLFQLMVVSSEAGQLEKALTYAREIQARKNIECGPEDYDGFCGRLKGIELQIEMSEGPSGGPAGGNGAAGGNEAARGSGIPDQGPSSEPGPQTVLPDRNAESGRASFENASGDA
ncbi:MAG: tetratricopeptide repeat protein [Myxococcota bacterium]